jgi:hypothetical protein
MEAVMVNRSRIQPRVAILTPISDEEHVREPGWIKGF